MWIAVALLLLTLLVRLAALATSRRGTVLAETLGPFSPVDPNHAFIVCIWAIWLRCVADCLLFAAFISAILWIVPA